MKKVFCYQAENFRIFIRIKILKSCKTKIKYLIKLIMKLIIKPKISKAIKSFRDTM